MATANVLVGSMLLCGTACIVWGATTAHGSGFGIFTQSAAGLGQANSVVAHVEGPSTVFFNPALITALPGTQVEAGTTLIFPHRKFRSDEGETVKTRDDLFYPSTLYLTHQFNENFSMGLGVFNPFGLSTDWGTGWSGRYLATRSELQTYAINPVVAYRISPSLSIAGGANIILLDATLENRILSDALGIPDQPFDVAQKFKGDGHGVGYNAGLAWKFSDQISIGASYRSEVEIDIDGDLTLSAFPEKLPGSTTLTLPQQVLAGIAWRPSDSLVLETGLRWEDWTSFRQLRITVPGQAPATYPREWHDTFSINTGAKYRINEKWAVMGGYLYGWNPVPDRTFEPSIPDSNTHLFCAGGEAEFDGLKVTMAYGYQLQENRSKTTNRYGPLANGTYSTDLHLLAISLGYSF